MLKVENFTLDEPFKRRLLRRLQIMMLEHKIAYNLQQAARNLEAIQKGILALSLKADMLIVGRGTYVGDLMDEHGFPPIGVCQRCGKPMVGGFWMHICGKFDD